jgi:hypothetical protein
MRQRFTASMVCMAFSMMANAYEPVTHVTLSQAAVAKSTLNTPEFANAFLLPPTLVWAECSGNIINLVTCGASREDNGLRPLNHFLDPQQNNAALILPRVISAFRRSQADILRNPKDDHTKPIFDASIRGRTDQVVMKFSKPR